MRTGAAWFALLALALPGFASVRGLCCEPGLTKGSGCCVSAMKMVGMGESGMASMGGAPVMDGAPVIDVRVAAVAECAMAPVGEGPEFVVRSKISFERDLLPARDQLPALAGTRFAGLSVAATPPSFFVFKTPPTLFLFDPLSVSLRI
jgi:hypothetical protein